MLASHCKETKQPHKKIKVDWFWGAYIPIYPPSLRPWAHYSVNRNKATVWSITSKH